MTNDKNDEAVARERLPYEPPRILSVEPLEAVAAVCTATTPPFTFGKNQPPCVTLGS